MTEHEEVRFSRRQNKTIPILSDDEDDLKPSPKKKSVQKSRSPKPSPREVPSENFKEKENKKCWRKNSMSSKLTEFLHQHRVVQKSLPHTHTTIHPAGSYNIKGKDLDEFWGLYSSHVLDANLPITLTEKPMGISPLRLDFDYKQKITKRQYNVKIIKKIVKIVQDIIPEIAILHKIFDKF